jgi:hypothetical protein
MRQQDFNRMLLYIRVKRLELLTFREHMRLAVFFFVDVKSEKRVKEIIQNEFYFKIGRQCDKHGSSMRQTSNCLCTFKKKITITFEYFCCSISTHLQCHSTEKAVNDSYCRLIIALDCRCP